MSVGFQYPLSEVVNRTASRLTLNFNLSVERGHTLGQMMNVKITSKCSIAECRGVLLRPEKCTYYQSIPMYDYSPLECLWNHLITC